jgi:hypothetical protein
MLTTQPTKQTKGYTMTIELFSQNYKGLAISASDFEVYLSLRALIVLGSVALIVAGFRRVRKVRGI